MPKPKKSKYVPVKENGVLNDKNIEAYNILYNATIFDLLVTMKAVNPAVADEYGEMQSEISDYDEDLDVPVKTDWQFDAAPTIKYKYDKRAVEIAEKALRDSSKALYDYLDNIGPDRRHFNKQVKAIAIWNDLDRGNMLQAMSEEPFLVNYKTQLSGATPDIFRIVDKTWGTQTPKAVLDATREDGILRPLLDFFEAGTDIYSLELWKNNEKKKGWNSTKEKKYLSQAYEYYGNVVKNYEALQKFPDEIQLRTGFLGNALEHLTARGEVEGRSCNDFVEGLRWKMKAIENGWTSDGLSAMNCVGIFDGSIQKTKYDFELNGEKEKLDEVIEWENRVLKPFKEELFAKKITSAVDMSECIDKIVEFDKKLQNDPFIKKYNWLTSISFNSFRDVIIPKTKNRIIDAMDKEVELGKPQIGLEEKNLKKADYSEGMKSLLESIRKTDNKEAQLQLVEGYLAYKFMDGKVMSAYPELFDPKFVGNKTATDELGKQCKNYAKALINALNPSSNEELADMLEYGDHGPFFSDIRDRIALNGKRSAMNDFLTGKADSKLPSKPVSEVIGVMKKGYEITNSTNTRFGDVYRGLQNIEQLRSVIGNDLRKKNMGDGPLVPNEAKLSEMIRNEIDCINKANSYLADKEKKIRDKGGDPNTEDGIALLGKNGAVRYKAMKEAKKSLLHTYKATMRLKENPISVREKEMLKLSSNKRFEIDGEDFRVEAVNEMFRKEIDKIQDASISEYENRVAENKRFENLSAEEKQKEEVIKAHENAIIDSAEKGMYCDMTIKMSKDMRKELMANAPKKFEHPEVLPEMSERERELAIKAREVSIKNERKAKEEFYKQTKKVLADVRTSVGEFVETTNGKSTFKKDSEQLKTFREIILNPAQPFASTFQKEALEYNKKGNILPSDVAKIRDKSITDCLKESKDLDNDRVKYEALADSFGSNAYKDFREGEIKAAEDAKKAQANKVVNNAVKK